jgi:hypothetical protein
LDYLEDLNLFGTVISGSIDDLDFSGPSPADSNVSERISRFAVPNVLTDLQEDPPYPQNRVDSIRFFFVESLFDSVTLIMLKPEISPISDPQIPLPKNSVGTPILGLI